MRKAEIEAKGSNLLEMQAEAEKQFAAFFGAEAWYVTGVQAQLELLSVGFSPDEWLPGLWSATFEAASAA